jgi:hypothetical protein
MGVKLYVAYYGNNMRLSVLDGKVLREISGAYEGTVT